MRALLDHLADLSVVGSFSRLGYALRAPAFPAADLDVDLRGKAVVVTGATSGIGLAAAHQLARIGAHVVLVGRSEDKLAAAAQAVATASGAERVSTERADLAELDEVEALASRLIAAHPALYSVVHNAGLLVNDRQLTRGGFERTFATHVLSPFLLTHRLRPALARASAAGAPSRVVWVTSGGMYTQHLDLARCQALTGPYDGVVAYAQQKRAQVILNERFATLLAPDGITSNAMHPGWVDTPGVASGLPRFGKLLGGLLRTPDQGADTITWLVASPRCSAMTGLLFLDRSASRTELFSKHTDAEKQALWDLCASLTRA